MRICNCEHPVKIFNPYTNEVMFVRCGKCDTCRNSRAKRWVDRLEQERSCHPFTFFVYLDYNDEHLPRYECAYNALEKENYLFDSQHGFEDKHFYEYVIPYHELEFTDKADVDYFNSRIQHPLSIPHGSVRDIQLFLKRLNKKFHDKVSKTYRNFRYFIVQEYGPTSHRPHYHGLVFVDSQEVADSFGRLFCESWCDSSGKPIGHADYDFVESTASSYVAQYLNCDTHLPSFYAHSKLRPFFLCSRQPPIGSLLQSETEVLEIFHRGSVDRVLSSTAKGLSLSVVSLLPSLKDRLFPKLPRFSSISHALRVALYRLADAENARYFQDFEEWKEFLLDRIYPKFLDLNNEFVRSKDFYIHNDLNRYICEISDDFEHDRPLREVFRISKRVLYQSAIFGVSLEYYVSRIELFYDNLEKYKLKQMYDSQIKLLDDGVTVVDDLVHMYPKYCEDINNSLSLGLDIRDVPDYKKMCSLHKEIANKNTKVSRKNAYFEGRLKNSDPLLYNTIKKFYYAKKRNEDVETLA